MSDNNKINRPHPGLFLKDEILKPRKLTVVKTAKLLGISRGQLTFMISGQRDLSLEMCHRLAVVFGENAEVWATRQMQHDLDKKSGDMGDLNLKPYQPTP